MKRSLLIFLVPLWVFTACKNEKKQTPQQTLDEAARTPSMHVSGSDFTVDVPSGWTTIDTTFQGIRIYFMNAPASTGGVSMNILHEGMQSMSLEAYRAATLSSMKQGMAGFEPGESGTIQAGDLDGIWFRYKMLKDGATYEMINYTLPKDGVAYIITGGAPAGSFDKQRSVFDGVARSFRLK